MFLDSCELDQIGSLIDTLNEGIEENREDRSLLTYEIKVLDCNGDFAGIIKIKPGVVYDPAYVFYTPDDEDV